MGSYSHYGATEHPMGPQNPLCGLITTMGPQNPLWDPITTMGFIHYGPLGAPIDPYGTHIDPHRPLWDPHRPP